MSPDVARLIGEGKRFAEHFFAGYVTMTKAQTEPERAKLRLWLTVKGMFPQLDEDEKAIVAEVLTLADPKLLHAVGLPSILASAALDEARIAAWNDAVQKFYAMGIMEKLFDFQKEFAVQFLLKTNS